MGCGSCICVFRNISIGTTANTEKEVLNLSENKGECSGGDGRRKREEENTVIII